MSNWRTIVAWRDPRHMFKGTELEVLIPDGFRSRFAVYSVRVWRFEANGARYADMCYRIRDAATVTDADVRAGIRPKIVAQFDNLDDALAYMEPHRVAEIIDD